MTKPTMLKTIDKDRRLSKAEYEKYRTWLADYQPRCQIYNDVADDTHQVLFGAYKDDRTLVSLCRKCHSQAHKDKKSLEHVLLPIARKSWSTYASLRTRTKSLSAMAQIKKDFSFRTYERKQAELYKSKSGNDIKSCL